MLCTSVKVLGKSVKPIPVMILGVLLARKKYPWLKYLFVLMITTGVAMFMYKPSKVQTTPESSSFVFGWGECLLVCAVMFIPSSHSGVFVVRKISRIIHLI